MLSFASDYTEGACEEILQKLAETNRESLPGYGMDRYCHRAPENKAAVPSDAPFPRAAASISP